jgi:DNA-binding transcriptional regulator YdaS (Cro superfamily)
MDLNTYISDTGRRSALAEAVGTSPDYLWQVATGWNGRKPGPDLAKAIERETERLGPEKVSKETLRPDLWGDMSEVA